MTIVITIDYYQMNQFKGLESTPQNQEDDQKLKWILAKINNRVPLLENQDVKDHRELVEREWDMNEGQEQNFIQVKNLQKIYNDGTHAVNKNSFCIKKGEVFGLLGPNGAGKSSTFNIMTMNLQRTSGDVKILNTDLDKFDINQQGNQLGMCPQDNTIWPSLTVDQCIDFICQVKGLSKSDAQEQKKLITDTLDLGQYSQTKAENLSGGNQRKLVCAMSLVGCPKVEFLDEPTTGVDPVSRRRLFKMLKLLNDSSLILTTHRMDEAEQLCTKIAIMINGRFVCYGDKTYLKQTYGEGYSISITHSGPLFEDDFGEFKQYMQIEQCLANEETDIQETIYKLKEYSTPLSTVFRTLQYLKDEGQNNIIDYTVKRSSLETVFLNFANQQSSGKIQIMQDLPNEQSSEMYSIEKQSLSPTVIKQDSMISKKFIEYMPNLSHKSQILSDIQVSNLISNLPGFYRCCEWERIFCKGEDGCALVTFFNQCADYENTVIILQDQFGWKFGAFCTEAWKCNYRFFGTGDNLLFTFEDQDDPLVYGWTGQGEQHQYSDNGSIGIGGSNSKGRFALYLTKDLYIGSSCKTESYSNCILSAETDFKCKALEVWAIVE